MEFEVLGTVRVRDRATITVLDGRLQRTLLAVLLAHANQPVPADVLVEAMWGSTRRGNPGRTLQVHVHRLRKALGDPGRLTFEQQGYRLRVLPGELDAERFTSLVTEAAELCATEPERCAEVSRKALDMWRDTPYLGLDVPLLLDESRRLADGLLAACKRLHTAELACGRHAEIVPELTELVGAHPVDEELHVLLMTALHRSGRRVDALQAYRTARRALADELGVGPGQALLDLERQVLAGEPAAATPHRVPAQLPPSVPGFTGRDAELSELDRADPVTVLTGTAGVGKTALAIRWAHEARQRFPDGQLFLDLRGYGPDAPVAPADALTGFLRALGDESPPKALDELSARFRTLVAGRRFLLVLDNARDAGHVRPLLPGSATCRTVVTSRDTLTGLAARDGAHGIAVAPLSLVESQELLRRLAGVDVESPAAAAVIERCARLPLTLRLAAELIKEHSGLAELSEELADERTRLDVFDVADDPHTAVRSVFSWSYQRLSRTAALVFRLCGRHPGRDLDVTSLAVMADAEPRAVRQTLTTLARAGLVDVAGDGRHRLHDLLRAYAAELASAPEHQAESDAALGRLFEHYLGTLAAARHGLDPHALAVPVTRVSTEFTRAEALAWYAAERDNLVDTVRAAAERGEAGVAWRLSALLVSFFYVHNDWEIWISIDELALAATERAGDRAGQARMLCALGTVYDDVARFDEAIAAHEAAATLLDELGDRHGAAWNVNNLGVVYHAVGRHDDALTCYHQALHLFRECADPRGQGVTLSNLGDVHRVRREFDEAIARLREALHVNHAAADRDAKRFTLRILGDLHLETGRSEQAMDWYRQSVVIAKEVGDRWRTAQGLTGIGNAHAELGDLAQARDHWQRALDIMEQLQQYSVGTAGGPPSRK